MRKQTNEKNTKDIVINNQKEFFKNYLTDNKGYPVELSDNLFIPFHNKDDEDYKSFLFGGGNELEEKLRAPHSSAALCINFFKYWKENDPIAFYKVLWETIHNKKLNEDEEFIPIKYEFEVKHLFGKDPSMQTGKPGFIDLEIRSADKLELIQVESKFTEPFNPTERYQNSNLSKGQIHNRDAYLALFTKYFECYPEDLMNGSETSKYYQLAQRLLFLLENANEEYNYLPCWIVLFIYFDYEGFDKFLLKFPEIIREVYRDNFKILSYQELFKALQNSFLNSQQHHNWFEYMKNRYFNF